MKTLKEFSDKFQIRVLSLKNIDNAENKEDVNGLYHWGKLFAATTWEEIKMIVKDNSYMESAASSLKILSEDEKIRQACQARAVLMSDMNSHFSTGKAEGIAETEAKYQPVIDQMSSDMDKMSSELTEKDRLLALKNRLIDDQRIDDYKKVDDDLIYRQTLYQEYQI